MAAWIVGKITIGDEALWSRYLAGAAGTFRISGSEVVVRGSEPVALTSRADGDRVVVAHFADMSAKRRCHDLAAYLALVALRARAADVVLTAQSD